MNHGAFFCIRLNLHLQLYVISSSGECYIKNYSNVTYIYGPPKAQTPQTLRSSFVQACIYISQGYCMPTTIARSV